MAPKHIMTFAPLLAFAVAANISTALHATNFGSEPVTINAPAPLAGIPARSNRTRGLILAEERNASEPKQRSQSGNPPTAPAPATEPPDLGQNRDLDRRASPEAANDLFQLLKQAGPKQGSKPK
jgi:hypothetical protein